jgi:hypothetical protein
MFKRWWLTGLYVFVILLCVGRWVEGFFGHYDSLSYSGARYSIVAYTGGAHFSLVFLGGRVTDSWRYDHSSFDTSQRDFFSPGLFLGAGFDSDRASRSVYLPYSYVVLALSIGLYFAWKRTGTCGRTLRVIGGAFIVAAMVICVVAAVAWAWSHVYSGGFMYGRLSLHGVEFKDGEARVWLSPSYDRTWRGLHAFSREGFNLSVTHLVTHFPLWLPTLLWGIPPAVWVWKRMRRKGCAAGDEGMGAGLG